MRSFVAYLPALACGAMMLAMCIPMLVRRRHESSDEGSVQQELRQLRQENERLKSHQSEQDRAGGIHV